MTATTASTSPSLSPSSLRTADQWLRSLGNVPLERIVLDPPPGTATVQDVVRLAEGLDKRLVELVNGTLVEKPVGFIESIIASNLIARIHNWSHAQCPGVVTGEQGMIRMLIGNVRMPDVAFIRREDLPDGKVPRDAAPRLGPTLAVEVLSSTNTKEEMEIKLREYFDSGVRVVWILDPSNQTLRVYDAPERFRQLTADDALDGGPHLPGFTVPRVGELFETGV